MPLCETGKNILYWIQPVVVRSSSRGVINISGSCFHFLMISVKSDKDTLTFIEAEFTLSPVVFFFFFKHTASTFSLSLSQNWHLYLQDLLELGNQCVSERFCLVLAGDFELSLWGVQLRLISKLLSWREKDWIANTESTNSILPCPPPLLSQLLGT